MANFKAKDEDVFKELEDFEEIINFQEEEVEHITWTKDDPIWCLWLLCRKDGEKKGKIQTWDFNFISKKFDNNLSKALIVCSHFWADKYRENNCYMEINYGKLECGYTLCVDLCEPAQRKTTIHTITTFEGLEGWFSQMCRDFEKKFPLRQLYKIWNPVCRDMENGKEWSRRKRNGLSMY